VNALLTDTGAAPVDQFSVPVSVDAITPLVGRLLVAIESAREKARWLMFMCSINRPKSGALYEPVHVRLLPLDSGGKAGGENSVGPADPLGKAQPEVIGEICGDAEGFYPWLSVHALFQACAESLNSENASRLAAMQRAERISRTFSKT